ncbi:MAG: cation:proton antiporter [Clostridia bacterium]|nr:cation:proton antiporter [Clostridia bacterium]
MLTSLGIILISGYILGLAFEKINLPSLLGMLITGIIVGPFALNLLDENILAISADLRKFALIIILLRAGLALDLKDLRQVGRPAVLLCFVPAVFEIAAITLIAPLIFDISYLEAGILGTVIAAVSPAVVVPRMLKLIKEGYGSDKKIPQLIMAGASVDDVFVIILFFTLLKISTGGSVTTFDFFKAPLSIILGAAFGVIIGYFLSYLFRKFHIRDSSKIIILLSLSILLVAIEPLTESFIPFSALLGVMFAGMTILKQLPQVAGRLSAKLSKLWIAAEIILFVLVGAAVDLSVLKVVSLSAVLLLALSLTARMLGVSISVSGSHLNRKEKIFAMAAYSPKATVQAAIGTIPLAYGLASGNIILSVAVLSIIITAPIGALLIDKLKNNLDRSTHDNNS